VKYVADPDHASALLAFVRTEFLPAAQRAALTLDTPLIESGILDSLRIAVLLNHIRDEFGVHIPLERMDAENFRDLRHIMRLLDESTAGVA
jgi:acyl carrier protein